MLLIIMIRDIDKKNSKFKYMNILQLKWILQNQIQKKNYKIIFKIINNLIHNIIKLFIQH